MNLTDDTIIKNSIFKIGKVVSVEGRAVRIMVDKSKNSSYLMYRGDLIKNVSVGSYIKILKGFTKIIAKVDGESVFEDKRYAEKAYSRDADKISRVLTVSLLGFFNHRKFERGIKEMPLIDNECHLLDRTEFEQVHNFIGNDDKPLLLGQLTLEKGQQIRIGIDSLFASHIGIFGNTGSGKSYTLAKLYYELFKNYKDNPNFQKHSRFFLIDFNGEYVNAVDDVIVQKEYKQTYNLSTKDDGDRYPIALETLYDPTFWTVILEATEKTQAPFIRRAIGNNYLGSRLNDIVSLKDIVTLIIMLAIDKKDRELGAKIIIELLSELENIFPDSDIRDVRRTISRHLQFWTKEGKFVWIQGSGNWLFDDDVKQRVEQELSSIRMADIPFADIDRLRLQIIIQYYDDIVKGHANREHLSPLIKRLEKRFDDIRKVIKVRDLPVEGRNLTIVSLKKVNIHIRKILPLLLCKQLYDSQKQKNDDKCHLNIIIDEAHNILSRDSDRESEQWKDYRLETFEEIIKEGRKFGVFLTIASQRPSDISSTIISQLHNYFLHRLINNNDIIAVEKTISYLDKLSFEYLPILPTGTAIFAGISAQVPVVIDIGAIESRFEPSNKTRSLLNVWED